MNEVPFHLTKVGRDFCDRTLTRLTELLEQLVRRLGPIGKRD
jgi:hypothetical protein